MDENKMEEIFRKVMKLMDMPIKLSKKYTKEELQERIKLFKKEMKRSEDDETKYTNYEICSKCKFSCCKQCACEIVPEDLKIVNKKSIIRLLKTGLVNIDRYEADEDNENAIYFLRMRNINTNILDYTWGDECLLYNIFGKCPIPFNYRPIIARRMIPKEDRLCTIDDLNMKSSSKIYAKDQWNKKKYQKILLDIIDNELDKLEKEI